MDTVVESAITLADYDWDTLSRRDLVKFNNNAFTSNPSYENDDDLNSLVNTGPSPLTFTLGRNHSSQITSLGASDGAFLSRPATTIADGYVPNKLNQYATVAGVVQGYDVNGNLTSDGTYIYEYDEENRLRSGVGAGNTVSYEYDPVGRRRAKVVNGTTTKFASDGAEEVEERDGSNNVLRKYVYGSGVDDRIAMLDSTACSGGGRCFYLTNWQGSTTTLINQSGTLNATYRYGPYGEGTNWTPSDALTGNPFRYTGRRVDPETGLYYYRARYYSPRTGRFLQTDPIGTKDDLNLYAFTHNDPVNLFDPNGEDSYNVARKMDPPLGSMGYGHTYTVSGATRIGDPNATVYSFAKLLNGNMGNVNAGNTNQTADMSKATAASDVTHWKSLAADTAKNISKIKAPDNVVAAVAGAVAENKPYALQPNDGSMSKGPRPTPEVNSNSSAFAIGDKSEQIASGDPSAHVDRTPFTLTLPGAGASGKVEFNCTDGLKRVGGC